MTQQEEAELTSRLGTLLVETADAFLRTMAQPQGRPAAAEFEIRLSVRRRELELDYA